MKTCIIIATKDRKHDLFEAIESIEKQTHKPDELIIVDASTNQDLERELMTDFSNQRISYIHTEPGLSKQRNIGIRAGSGEVIFFFDDDVVLERNYINSILKVFENDERGEIGAVMGRIMRRPMSLKVKIKRLIAHALNKLFLLDDSGDGRFKLSGLATHPHHMNQPKYIECLTGCCMAFKREVFANLEFDENLVLYSMMDDYDISKGLLNLGYKIFYEPAAKLLHKRSPTSRLNKYHIKRMWVVNHYYLFRKYWRQTPLTNVAFWWSIIGMVLSSLYSPQGIRGMMAGILDILKARGKLVRTAKKLKYEESSYKVIPVK